MDYERCFLNICTSIYYKLKLKIVFKIKLKKYTIQKKCVNLVSNMLLKKLFVSKLVWNEKNKVKLTKDLTIIIKKYKITKYITKYITKAAKIW